MRLAIDEVEVEFIRRSISMVGENQKILLYGILTVERTLTNIYRHYNIEAKGGKQRRVLVDGETVDRFVAYSLERAIASSRPIFPLSTCHVHRIVNRYGPLVGKDIHSHTLCYSFAINLVRNGMDIARVLLVLGHANLNTTRVYLQLLDSDIREARDAVAF